MTNRPLLLLLSFLYSCNVSSGENSLDPSHSENWLMPFLSIQNTSFTCTSTPTEMISVASLSFIQLECNQRLSSSIQAAQIQSKNPELKNLTLSFASETSLIIAFDSIKTDGIQQVDVSLVKSASGLSLTTSSLSFLIDNSLPSIELSGYKPKLDYSFFNAKYFDFTTSEELKELGTVSLSGALASAIFIRSTQKLGAKSYRLNFETTFNNTDPSQLLLSFPTAKDLAGNLVQNQFAILLTGLTQGPSMVAGRQGYNVLETFLLSDHSVLVAGGGPINFERLASGSATFQLSTVSSYAVEIGQGYAALTLSGKPDQIMIAGGGVTAGPLSTVQIYDYTTDSMRTIASLNQARLRHRLLTLKDGRVLITGGVNDVSANPTIQALTSAEIFDPTTETFTTLPSMNGKRMDHCMIQLADGRVWIAGGATAYFVGNNTTEFFDPVSNTFSNGPSIPGQAFRHRCILLGDGKVFFGGGEFFGSTNQFFLFDPLTNQINLLAQASYPRERSAFGILPDGGIFIHGGGATSNQVDASRNNEKLDYLGSKAMLRLSIDKKTRKAHSILRMPDGVLMLLGGIADGTSDWNSETLYYGK